MVASFNQNRCSNTCLVPTKAILVALAWRAEAPGGLNESKLRIRSLRFFRSVWGRRMRFGLCGKVHFCVLDFVLLKNISRDSSRNASSKEQPVGHRLHPWEPLMTFFYTIQVLFLVFDLFFWHLAAFEDVFLFSRIRMTPRFMILGHSSGTAHRHPKRSEELLSRTLYRPLGTCIDTSSRGNLSHGRVPQFRNSRVISKMGES